MLIKVFRLFSLCPVPPPPLSLSLLWSHLQASEQDILKYVVKWGEQQLIKRMADRGKIIQSIITLCAAPPNGSEEITPYRSSKIHLKAI